MALVVPSVLSADFGRLAEQVQAAEAGGADRLQIDVMDGQFVSNITFGPVVVEAIRRATRLPLEVHLMIVEPERHLAEVAAAGGDILIVHQEVSPHLHRTIERIKGLGKKAGVAINPATPLSVLQEILPDVDQVLCMTVDPGFGGQPFIAGTLPKIERLRALINQWNAACDLEVDGGIQSETAAQAVRAGANVLVAGSSTFGDPGGVAVGIAHLRAAVA
jgi:ribulose-phosphate 3-epimerase